MTMEMNPEVLGFVGIDESHLQSQSKAMHMSWPTSYYFCSVCVCGKHIHIRRCKIAKLI